jgi:hypothetical protein
MDYLKVKVMKKIIISAASVLLLIFSSCYDDNKNATIRINLGNIPLVKNADNRSVIDRFFSFFIKDAYAQTDVGFYNIDVLHIAVYSGDTIVTNESFNSADIVVDGNYNSSVELTVPSGSDMTILVVGEYNSDGIYANYLGFNRTALSPGDNDVSIAMKTMSAWASSLNAGSVANSGVITWSKLDIPVKYVIEDQINNNTIVYEGDGSSAGSLSGGCFGFPFPIYLKFDQFGITSSAVDTVSVYDSNQC